MTLAKAERHLLERLGTGQTVLLSLHLAVPEVPGWCDGRDEMGRAVLLVGRHRLGEDEASRALVAAVLEALGKGEVPEGVHAIGYTPKASAAIAEIAAGKGEEILLDGPRGSGKTQAVPAAFAALAELHARAGFALPLRATWLHDSLLNASVKTAASLEEPLWGGLWSMRDDRHRAVLTVGATEYVIADFAATLDEAASERLRASAHVVAAEELIPSLAEFGGIDEKKYDLARSSLLRLPGRRRVAVATTNPGAPDTWAYRRWIEDGGRPGCVRCQVPGTDRLGEAELAALHETFRDSPDLQARLARGEWADLILGPQVAKGFDPLVHVAKQPIPIMHGLDFYLGWDSGASHCHAVTIGQRNGGRRNIFAGLVREDSGLKQFLELDVLPWFRKYAPWALTIDGRYFIHRYDPSMNGFDGGDADLNPLRRIRDTLGRGHWAEGPTAWPDREGPMLALLADGDGKGGPALQISPVDETRLLIQALTSRWYYGTTKGGQVVKDSGPYKPNRPWEDLGDSFAYWCGGVAGVIRKPRAPGSHKPALGVQRSVYTRPARGGGW